MTDFQTWWAEAEIFAGEGSMEAAEQAWDKAEELAQKKIEELTAKRIKAVGRLLVLQDKMEQIQRWCEAYPFDVFPEPDFKEARNVLKDHGIRLDDISASNMRHVLQGIQAIINNKR